MSKNKKDFTFVGQERKVYDQQIEGKPIGYLKDAMMRFRRNKMNMTAAVILALLVLLAIFVPIFTNKNYENIEEQLTYLSPRVPILEKFGILDGKKNMKQIPVDFNKVDKETGLFLPAGHNEEYITPGTLTNYEMPSIDSGPSSLGGEVRFSLRGDNNKFLTQSLEMYPFEDKSTFVNIEVTEVNELGVDGALNIYIRYRNRLLLVGSTSEVGTKEFFVELPFGPVEEAPLYIELVSSNPKAYVDLKYINVKTAGEEVYASDSYQLTQDFEFSAGGGSISRVNNYSIYANFIYDQYNALFSERTITMAGNKYEEIRAENPDVIPVEDPENPGQYIFPENFVIKRVISSSTSEIDGKEYTTYQVIVDYAKYMGYSKTPYFLFGTDASGRDLFSMTWVGLRTSLIIGVVVSLINISFGVVYGAISGYYGGKVDLVMERITEVIGRIPWLVTLSIFTALIGPGFLTLIIILIISGWIGVASVTRTQFYRYKGREYVLASRTLGANDRRLIFRHILPNGIGTIITSSILMIPGVIFSEASISYLGFGIGHGQTINLGFMKLSGVSLGVLLADGQTALLDFPHLTVYPAIIISLLMITFNMFGNGLRDAFNPSLRGAE